MSIYTDPILVTLSYDDPFISLQTLDSKHGKSQRFFLSKEALTHNTTEIDLQNVCTVTHYGKAVLFCLYWLHSNCDDGLYGYQQGFRIPEEKIEQVLKGETIRHLSYTQHKKARIFFTKPAHETIGQCNKLERHALRRFFRDQFNYDEDIVVQRDQLVRGFYLFSTLTPYEGGIVRHTSTVRDSFSRTHEKVAFSIHT